MGGRGSTGSTTAVDALGTRHLSSESAVRETQVENRIRAAYNESPQAPGGYVGLADLREHRLLRGISRAEIDAALRRGNRRGMQMSTVDNTRGLRPRDRDAALDVGGNPRHMVSYRPSSGSGRVAPMLPLPAGSRK